MDPTTWNAYQIVSNRARSICYATRQDQFRIQSEMSVNKLLYSTRDQIKSIKGLQVN